MSAPSPAPGWELTLSSGARRLVGLILLLGLLSAAGEGAWAGTTISAAVQRDREISQLNTDVAQYNAVVKQFDATVTAHNAALAQDLQTANEATAANSTISDAENTLNDALQSPLAVENNCVSVACYNTVAQSFENGLAALARTVSATPVPSGSAAIKKQFLADNAALQQTWTQLTEASSMGSLQTISANGETADEHFINDGTALTTSLNNQYTMFSNEVARLNDAQSALSIRGADLYGEGEALTQSAATLNVKINVLPIVVAN